MTIDGTRGKYSSENTIAWEMQSGLGPATLEARPAAGRRHRPDREILVALYNATDGPNWGSADNWLTDAPLGSWYGVDVDALGRVTELFLPFKDLSGPIPPELGNLTNLTYLWLAFNELSGPIPAEIGNLSSLERLRLRGNELTSPIPQSFLAELFRSPFAQEQFNEPQRGIKNSFRLTDVIQLVISLPPSRSSDVSAAKVDQLMALCDGLEASVTAADGTRSCLLESLLHDALAFATYEAATASRVEA